MRAVNSSRPKWKERYGNIEFSLSSDVVEKNSKDWLLNQQKNNDSLISESAYDILNSNNLFITKDQKVSNIIVLKREQLLVNGIFNIPNSFASAMRFGLIPPSPEIALSFVCSHNYLSEDINAMGFNSIQIMSEPIIDSEKDLMFFLIKSRKTKLELDAVCRIDCYNPLKEKRGFAFEIP